MKTSRDKVSGASSSARARSPACQAATIGSSCSPQPSQRKNSRVDGHGRVRGEQELRRREPLLGAAGYAEEAAGELDAARVAARALLAPRTDSTIRGRPLRGRKLVTCPSACEAASSSILPRSAARTIGTGAASRLSSLKPPAPRSPASTGRRNSSVSRMLRQRRLERGPVPALDDDVRRGAEAEHEAPAGRVGERRGVLRERRAPA